MRPRLLVVDDDARLRAFIERFFAASFDVDGAPDGAVARDALAQDETYDVILLDLAMPHLDGRALYELLATDRPELARRVIFLTGGPLGADDDRFLRSVTNVVLYKPFDNDELRRIVHLTAGLTT